MIKAQSAPALVPIRYGLRATGLTDLALVCGWPTEPHVRRWWPNPEGTLRTITRRLSEPAIEGFIVTMDGRDLGYMRLYDPHHAPPPAADEQTAGHPYRDQPRGTHGIDVVIGEARVTGRGRRSRHIRRGGVPL